MAQTKYTNGSGVAEIWANIKNYIASQLLGYSQTGHTHSASDITSGLSTVATSGSYNDLSNKPTIPTVNNATLTIQKNGTTVNSFTANASSNVTANITVPTKVSELTNDSGYITSSGSCNYANSAGYVQGNNNSANAANALLRSGGGRTDSSPEGDTWIFLDSIGGSSAPWGFKHNQAANTIGFYGAGTETSSINLSNGYFSGSCNYANSAGGVAWDNVSGKPSAFTPYFANGTWYNVGDDVAIGDHNVGGGLGVCGLNSTTRIDFCQYGNAGNYKSITYDGTTLYMNGSCDYATSAGSCNYANSAGSSSIATRDSGGSWISGRDNAVVKQTRHSTGDGYSWNPAVSIKTKDGNWTIGTVGYNNLQFSYDTDEDYNTGNNSSVVVNLLPESGTIITSANIGSQSVNYANSAGSAGSVAWTNVSGRPWAVSQFTNDSGFITSADCLPIGSYIQFAGSQAPTGFLVCNGGAVSRTTYSALFAVIGTTYGGGDGWSTFNLPNLTDRFLQGSTTSGTVKNAGLPNIQGEIGGRIGLHSAAGAFRAVGNADSSNAASSVQGYHGLDFNASRSSSIYGNSSTVQPPALTCLICIKY